jgi:UDP-3-O-[3-hydroxymyristoyl] N-acetylglucosamine deacetylase/3-hydroxyacyl-[acyl-carrier-protein] dehydratase
LVIEKQTTLKRSVTLSGIALHTGHRVNLVLQPAPPNHGICFRRLDLPEKPMVQAALRNVVDTRRQTTIAAGAAKVHTAEHLLAAFNALGVDNILAEMTGPEPPVLDGSAKPFVDAIRHAGTVEQDVGREYLELTQPVFFEAGQTRMVALPDPAFRVSCTVKYNATPLDCQYLSIPITAETFVNELCEARTFCLYEEIEPLMAANLICGGSLENAVIIKGSAIFSKDGLRYEDEFVRHKILDLVGDLFLLGRRLRAHIIAIKPGHPTNVALACKIAELTGMAGQHP